MQINQIMKGIEYRVIFKGKQIDVNEIKVNSKQIQAGNMYIALEGKKTDGHQFIREAFENGAAFFLINSQKLSSIEYEYLSNVTCIAVNDTRKCLSQVINNFYQKPSEHFKLIGVTGTNGKTSVTTMADYVFQKLGYSTGLIGTIDNYVNNRIMNIEKTNSTTPDCVELGKIMNEFVENQVEVALMEVSSMALKMHRVDACDFDVAVYNNISPEHLDDHKTMEDYLNSKLLLFDLAGKAVVNVDDEKSNQVIKRCLGEILTFGIKKAGNCDIYAKDISYASTSVSFHVVYKKKEIPMTITTPSEFAIYNTLAVIGICIMCGLELEQVIGILEEEIHIEGRYDILKTEKPYSVIIDYAHTPKALENLLEAVKKNINYNRIITVFGCGGDRDSSKRSVMGRISQNLSDITILTSDNPRTEKPIQIIENILDGMNVRIDNYCIKEDRRKAIEYAVSLAKDRDVVVIAGKGHEKEQILNGLSLYFSDKEAAMNAIRNQ